MYLLIGDPQDPFCTSVRESLETRGYEARIIANPMAEPLRFAWQLATLSSVSQLICEDGTRLLHSEIAGVLVRSPGWLAPDGWNPCDLAYVQKETHAALLAWLWSLDCPVINRYPAAPWHWPLAPLLFWQPRLEQCGLRALESLVSNVEEETRAFGTGLGCHAVYAPLTTETRYRLECEDHWAKLAAMQRLAPVHLTQASLALHSACVVGPRVLWEGAAPPTADTLEPALTLFSTVAGLTFVEITIAIIGDGPRVAAVNPYPRVEHFGQSAQREMIAGLVQPLTGELGSAQMRTHDGPQIRSRT